MRRTRILASGVLLATALAGCGSEGIPVEGGDATIDVTISALEDAPVARRADASIVWTGSEFLVTGGVIGDEKFGDDGEPETEDDGPVETTASDEPLVGTMPVHAYDPVAGTWRTPAPAPLDARSRHVSAWTGDEVLVWGGTARRNGVGDLLDAAAWDPATDTWRELPPSPVGTDRSYAEAVLVGRFVVIGGGAAPQPDRDGDLLAFDLAEEAWSVVPGGGTVVDLHATGDGSALVLRRQPTGDGDEYVVSRLRVDEQDGLVDERVGPPLADPAQADDAPDETFPFAAGLLGSGGDVALVVEPANDLPSVLALPPGPGDPWADAVRVADLQAGGTLEGFGTSPALVVDGAVVQFGRGNREPRVAYEPATGIAREVVTTPERPDCVNGLSWAVGDGLLLLVSGDCGGEVVTATARG